MLWSLLGPFALISEERFCDVVHTVQKFLTVLEISLQVRFRGPTYNSLKGPIRIKMKAAYCSDFILYFKQLLFCNAFKNICSFRDIRGLRFAVLAESSSETF